MTIDETIEDYERWAQFLMNANDIKNAKELKRRAEWLKELKRYKEQDDFDDAAQKSCKKEIKTMKVMDKKMMEKLRAGKSTSPITNIVETPLVIADRIVKECNYDNKKIKKVVKYLKTHIKLDQR